MRGMSDFKSEIRDNVIRELLAKTKRGNYAKFVLSVRLEQIRQFTGSQIRFDFPVTALVGPNGSGKSTVLAVVACAYDSVNPSNFFFKSRIGDTGMDDWRIEYEIIDRDQNPSGTIRSKLSLLDEKWSRTVKLDREVKFIGVTRTVPAIENPLFLPKRRLRSSANSKLSFEEITDISVIKSESEKILGKSLSGFRLLNVTITTSSKKRREKILTKDEAGRDVAAFRIIRTQKQRQIKLYIGSDGTNEYSELNFGSGEAAVIRMIAELESLPNHSLVLIEEIENGLHPVAVRRMIEYLIDLSKRKSVQVVFTTHSDYALAPLPSEAIWASIDGRLQQGKLSIEALRAISGRIDRRLAIFVEDDFARAWVVAVLREKLGEQINEIGVYAVSGDGNAVKTHIGHSNNPAVSFHSICFIDGDSNQTEDDNKRIYRLPGSMPELTVFNSVLSNLENNLALLTVACQRSLDKQNLVSNEIKSVSHTNRDPHLLFGQIGLKIGFVPETIVRGAFLTVWIQENHTEAENIVEPVRRALALPSRQQI